MPKKKRRKPTKEERERWSDERLRAVLGRAVLPDGRKAMGGNGCPPEEMQRIVMDEAEEKSKAQ